MVAVGWFLLRHRRLRRPLFLPLLFLDLPLYVLVLFPFPFLLLRGRCFFHVFLAPRFLGSPTKFVVHFQRSYQRTSRSFSRLLAVRRELRLRDDRARVRSTSLPL